MRINLKPLPASASKVSLKVSAAGRDKTADFSTTPSTSWASPSRPAPTAKPYSACKSSTTAAASLARAGLDQPGQRHRLRATDHARRGEVLRHAGIKLIIQLVNGADGSGKVSGPGIDCGGGGSDCEEVYRAGTQVSPTASATVGNFIGWTGGCTGVGACSLTLTPAGDFTVQASFGVCRGWCPEPSGSPAPRSAGPPSTAATPPTSSRWATTAPSPAGTGRAGSPVFRHHQNLYAITVPRGSTSYVAVGESGTVLGNSGMGWYAIPVNPATTKDLLGVSGVSENEIRIVGQDATFLRGDLRASPPARPCPPAPPPPASSTASWCRSTTAPTASS